MQSPAGSGPHAAPRGALLDPWQRGDCLVQFMLHDAAFRPHQAAQRRARDNTDRRTCAASLLRRPL